MQLVKHPILCNYYLTYRCNASCGFCDIWEKPSPYVTLEQVEENFKALKRLKVKVIDFTGGEPLLHREIDKILALAKQYGFITTVTTNALLYPKWAQKIKGLVDMLHFSLDSVDEQKHNLSRNVACFQHVQDSIQLAKSLGEKPDILFTVTESNIDELEELYQEYALKHDLVVLLNPIFEYNGVGTGLDDASLEKLSRFGKKKNMYLNEAFVALRKDGGNHIDNPVCKAASTTIVISPQNELMVPCYHLGTKSFPIQGDLEQLYWSKEVKSLRDKEGRLKACESCVINCYMQPSFSVNLTKYFWKALPSTLKYNYIKGTWKQLF